MVSILEDLQNIDFTGHNNSTETSRLKGYFCSETVFNLSKKVLTEAEIKVLEKGLDYAPIQNKVNEPELRSDFEEFCRRMRLKWYFRNDPTPDFSEKPSFTPKSSWKPPTGHPNLEVFLSELEKQIFKIVDSKLGYSNFSKEEWQTMRALAGDRSIVTKKAERLKINLVMQMFARMFSLMKRICRKLWEQVINFFRTSSLMEKLVINCLNTLRMGIKKFLT